MAVKLGYKQTEIGVIPEEWEVKQLGAMCIAVLDCDHSTPVWTKTGTVVIRNQNIRNGKLDLSEASFTDEKHFAERTRRAVPTFGDLVITREAPMGLVCMIPEGLRCCLGQRMVLLRLNRVEFNSTYALYALLSEGVQRSISVAGGTGSTVSNLRIPALKQLQILVPDLPEQRAIATALSDVDALLGALERLIAKKRDLKQAAMQQLLTGQTRLPGFDGEWGVMQLGEVATFLKGKGLPKSALVPDGSDPCIHYGELFTKYPETIGEIFSRTNGMEDSFRSVANDVLMPTSDVTPRGLAKASCVIIDGVILGGDILVIRSDKQRVFGPFLSYIIRREESQVLRLVTGSTVYHLYGSDMKKFIFSLPSLSEQTAIATVLSDMDAELVALEQRLAKTRALKQGMMQELLTGRTRLV
ncbi:MULTISPECIES: restriction endonuclease subunit S [Pseudomonas]|uniref:Type I restriction enzyme, S subunit n=1 Tax=Pseudomonas lutea TaxID=243924 RepID=A0A9X8MHI8_9PSED|nr:MULTISPECIES: restriction endonuclease subunit S [Pseudomonas]SER44312.1 type I restriction enzyme, S subunit [Pseudomonas lutea]